MGNIHIEHKTKMNENEIDEELQDTFPASDPPSWTLGLDPDKASMKALRIHAYGGPERLQFENVPVPKIAQDQVLVRISAASVNPIDYKLASGALRPVMNNKGVALPWVPGGDFSGTIESLGAEAKGLRRGEAVFGNCPSGGSYAQFAAVNVNALAPKPQRLNFIEAASIPLAAQTAWQALFDHGHLTEGQSVLIHGASGGVGSFAVQLAHWKKARVLATGSGEHIEYLRGLGASQAINYKTEVFDSIVKDMDLVIDLIGGQTQERSFKVLKKGGILVSTVETPSPVLAEKQGIRAVMMSMKPSGQLLEQLAGLLEQGIIVTNVTKVYPLFQAKEAWKDILSHHSKGKIVLEI